MNYKKTTSVALLTLISVCSLPAMAQTAADAGAVAAPALTGNLALVSDYRFRGISQTWKQPAVQGGFDYNHASGLYLGNWNSSVSGNSYNNGASLEMDIYGGYKFNLSDAAQGDVGVLYYYYPGANLNSAPGVASDRKYNNTELYFGLNWGSFSGKLSYAVSDYFGLNGTTASYAYWSGLPDRGGSEGTTYLDLNYSVEVADKLVLGLHAGHAAVRHYGELSYTDYKLSLTQDVGGYALGAAVIGTNADKAYYQVGNSSWNNPKKVGEPGLVLSVAKTF